jgi:hypothetical protein
MLTSNHQPLAISYWLSAIGYQLLAISYWLSAIGYQLLAISYWLLPSALLQRPLNPDLPHVSP